MQNTQNKELMEENQRLQAIIDAQREALKMARDYAESLRSTIVEDRMKKALSLTTPKGE